MLSPFTQLRDEDLDPKDREAKESIDRAFDELETLFAELHDSDKRLIPLPGSGLPTLSMPFEFATVHTLRTLELAEGAALVIERGLYPAAFPLVRCIFETWIALSYADIMFRRHVVDANQWDRFNEKAIRLLQANTSDPEGPEIIKIGAMLDEVKRYEVERAEREPDQVGRFFDQVYADLSDGTHPTLWSLAHHFEARADGTGIDWKRKAAATGRGKLLFDLGMCMNLMVPAVRRILASAEEIDEAFRAGPGTDPALREKAILVLERVLANPPDLAPEAQELLEQRGMALLDYYKRQRTESQQEG